MVSYASYVLAQALTLSQCKNIQQFRFMSIMQLSCAMNMTSGICQWLNFFHVYFLADSRHDVQNICILQFASSLCKQQCNCEMQINKSTPPTLQYLPLKLVILVFFYSIKDQIFKPFNTLSNTGVQITNNFFLQLKADRNWESTCFFRY